MIRLVRALGLALFMASLALLGWWWIRVAGSDVPGGGWRAAGVDAALFSGFALHHSLFARPGAKAFVERVVPHDLVRTAYVWVASALLTAMCVCWQPVGGVVYHATGIGAIALGALQVLGVLVGLLAVRRISVRELAGLAEPEPAGQLQDGGPFSLVRHPLYLGWVLIVGATAHMTGDRLCFAIVSTVYLLIAMPFEEAGLTRLYGGRYVEYRRAVRWRLIPYIH